MASKCVNISHPDFKNLLEQTGKDAFELEMDVAAFQSRTGEERFPTVSELTGVPVGNVAIPQEPVRQQNADVFRKDLGKKLEDHFRKKYPNIKLSYTYDDIDSSATALNQIGPGRNVNYRTKLIDTLITLTEPAVSKKTRKGYTKGKPIRETIRVATVQQRTNFEKELTRRGVPRDQIDQVFAYLDSNNIDSIPTEDLIFEMLEYHSYAIGLNLSVKDSKPSKYFSDISLKEYKAKPSRFKYQEITFNLPFEINLFDHFSDRDKSGPSTIGHVRGYVDKKTGNFIVLEVQSDAFQRGGHYLELIAQEISEKEWNEALANAEAGKKGWVHHYANEDYATITTPEGKYTRRVKELKYTYYTFKKTGGAERNFLELLNRDSRWVRFFIHSIVQAASKKGRPKVLFPNGLTAAIVEGFHVVEDKIKELEESLNRTKEMQRAEKGKFYIVLQKHEFSDPYVLERFSTKKQAIDRLNAEHANNHPFANDAYITSSEEFFKLQIEKTLEKLNHYRSATGGKLNTVRDFYQSRIGNILKKDFGDNVKEIKDEFGHTWRELTLAPEVKHKVTNILLQQDGDTIRGQADIKAMSVLINAVHQKQDTLPHEYAHHYIRAFHNTPIVKTAIKRWAKKNGIKLNTDSDGNLIDDINYRKAEEALVQDIGEQVVKQEGEAYNWWKRFVKWILNALSDRELLQVLTDSFIENIDLERQFAYQEQQPATQPIQPTQPKELYQKIEWHSKENRPIYQAIHETALRLSHRLGIKYKIIDNPNEKWKGRFDQFSKTAYINLAYATKDTPVHEIAGHPIIAAIESENPTLYKNLEQTLEKSELGRNVLERVKRTYVDKIPSGNRISFLADELTRNDKPGTSFHTTESFLDEIEGVEEAFEKIKDEFYALFPIAVHYTNGKLPANSSFSIELFRSLASELGIVLNMEPHEVTGSLTFKGKKYYVKRSSNFNKYGRNLIIIPEESFSESDRKYSLKEQKREAIVELLGMLTADKIDKAKNGSLIQALKELLKRIDIYLRSLFKRSEVDIALFKDNMTLDELSDFLAYGNNKILLPGNMVVYETPLGEQFLSYAEAVNHVKKWTEATAKEKQILNPVIRDYTELEARFPFFEEKNKQYVVTDILLKKWKKEEGIVYDPNEAYEEGEAFFSEIGAFTTMDLKPLLKNIVRGIENNAEVGNEFVISAYTRKPDDKEENIPQSGVRFKIYPAPEDIQWAAFGNVYSGSVRDSASSMKYKRKKEASGISYTKAPAIDNIRLISSSISNSIKHRRQYNELGIILRPNNFRFEYDDHLDSDTKHLIHSLNLYLDRTYGKIQDSTKGKTTTFTQNENKKTFIDFTDEHIILRYDHKGTDIIFRDEKLEKEYEKAAIEKTSKNLLTLNKSLDKKYPEFLITSTIVNEKTFYYNFEYDDLPFQKIPVSKSPKPTELKEQTSPDEPLKALLEQAGFKLVSFERYSEITGKPIDGDAVVDFARKMVAVADGKMGSLPEEYGHILIENLSDEEVDKLIPLVEKTPEYEQVKRTHGRKYNNDTRKIAKEALGQIAGRHVLKRIERKSDYRLVGTLRRLWEKFLGIFRNDALKNYMNRLAEEAVGGRIDFDIDSNERYWSNPNEETDPELSEEEKFLHKALKAIKDKNRVDEEKLVNPQLRKRKRIQTRDIERNLELGNYTEAILETVRMIRKDIKDAQGYVRSAKNGQQHVTPSVIRHLQQFIAYYRPLMDELESLLDNDDILVKVTQRTTDRTGIDAARLKEALLKRMQAYTLGFKEIEQFERYYNKKLTERIWREQAARELGLSLDDPALDEKIKARTGLDIKAESSVAYKDSSLMQTWFGTLREASSGVLNLIYAAMKRIRTTVVGETMDWGQDFLRVAKEMGFLGKNLTWMYEEEEGKKTGNFKQLYRVHAHKQALEEFAKQMHKEFGFPEDFHERRDLKVALRQADDEKIREYDRRFAEWFAQNTMPIKNPMERIEEMRNKLSPEQFAEWHFNNVVEYEDRSGQRRVYFKGELSIPTDGRMRNWNGQQIKSVDWTSQDYKDLSDEQKDFLEYVRLKKREIDEQIGVRSFERAPQLTESTVDILYNRSPDIFKRLGRQFKETFRVIEDDKDIYGLESTYRPDGSIQRYLPKRYISLLDDPDALSSDVLSSMISYFHMASEFQNMSKNVDEFEVILTQVGRRTYQGKKETKPGSETEVYKQLDKFMEMNMYGQHRKDLVVNGVSISKILSKLTNWFRNTNLAWNLFTSTSNYFQAAGRAVGEALVGEHYSAKAYRDGHLQFFQNHLSEIAVESGNPIRHNKLGLLLFRSNVWNHGSLFDNLDKDRLTKVAIESGMYWNYELADLAIKGPAAMAVLLDMHVMNGAVYSSHELKRDGINPEELPTVWDSIHAKNGEIISDLDNYQLQKVLGKIEYVSNNLDGKLSREDYAAAHQHAIGNMLTTHRGWLIDGIQKRFKGRNYNYMTGQEEIGHYRAVGKFLKATLFNPKRYASFKEMFSKVDTLDDVERKALYRAGYEYIQMGLALAFALIVNSLADAGDDDENWAMDSFAYLTNRVVLEVGSFTMPIFLFELANTMQNPIMMTHKFEQILDLADFFSPEEVESGPFKGQPRALKAVVKQTPILKSLWQMKDPASANQYIKNKPLRFFY